MFRFGYDFYDDGECEIVQPNGTLGYDDAIGKVFQIYLPPWWGELLSKVNKKYEILSVGQLSKNSYKEKWIYILEPLGDPYGWLGKYKNKNFVKSLFSGISELALKNIKEDKAIICIWHPNESPMTNHLDINLFEEFHKELKTYDIKPSSFILIYGNLIGKKQYRKWKKDSKFKDDEEIKIIEFQSERHLNFEKKWNLAQFHLDTKVESTFLCYNRCMIHSHRILLLTLLQKENVLDKGLVSYPEFDSKSFNNILLNTFRLGKGIRKELLESMDIVKSKAPSVVDVDEWETNHFDTSYPEPYEKTLVSVISETNFVQDTLFLTEKIWKAIANKHPFIVVGNYKTLDYLKREGFKTFHPFIDESYDSTKSYWNRIVKISKEVKRLSGLGQYERMEFRKKIKDIIDFNFKKLMNDDKDIEKMFDKLSRVL